MLSLKDYTTVTYRILAILCICLCDVQSYASGNKPAIKPVPHWVEPVGIPYHIKINERLTGDGYYYMLCDEQVNIPSSERFIHNVLKITNDAGIQNASEININFDPDYQSVQVHYVRLIRNGKIIDKLDLSKVKILQREDELESKVYDGRLTVFMVIADTRKFDFIEYAFTVTGRNPIFNGRFFSTWNMGYSEPLAKQFIRILTTESKRLNHRIHGNSKVMPSTKKDRNGNISYCWSFSFLEPIKAEENCPDNYPEYPYLEVSEFNSWEEVVNWALPMYQLKAIDPQIEKKAREITSAHKTKGARAIALMRFVQDEIRYLGFEMGVNSHKPSAPADVLSRRFGDCKDKSLLLCAMFKVIGIEAYPALIHTTLREYIEKGLPSPQQFNHVTVHFKIDGRPYWVDPTCSFQRGSIDTFQYPDYKAGLVVRAGENAITQIYANPIVAKKIIHETFTTADSTLPVKLHVATSYFGQQADQMRYEFATGSSSDIEKSYIEFYESLYKDVSIIKDIETIDDESHNIFMVIEDYELGLMWRPGKADGIMKFEVFPQTLMANIEEPKKRTRKTPYKLSYPYHIEQNIIVKMPESWGDEEEEIHVSNEHFSYSFNKSVSPDGKTTSLKYDYMNGRAEVPPEAMGKYCDDIEEATRFGSYSFSWTGPVSASAADTLSNRSLLRRLLPLLLILGVVAMLRIIFTDKKKRAG